MTALASLERQRQSLLDEIARLPPMRQGSVRPFSQTRKSKDGSAKTRGPYWRYTFKHKGKTCGRHVGDEAAANVYREQIEVYRRFEQLSARLVEVSRRMADLAVEKKGFSKRSKA